MAVRSNVDTGDYDWQPVIGRALAMMCLHAEELRAAPLVDQWLFLEKLGVRREDAATLLSTTAESLRVSSSRRKSQTSKKSRS